MDGQGMGPTVELAADAPLPIFFVDVAMAGNRADVEPADVQLAFERSQAVQAMVGSGLAKVFPLRAALVAIDAAVIHGLGLWPVAGRGRRVEGVVMHDQGGDR